MSQQLKPCSCCDDGVATGQGGKSVRYLKCNNCEWRTHFYESWVEAYTEWNNHHAPVPPAGDAEAGAVDFGTDGRSVRASQEAYSIFLAGEQASKDRIAALQQRLVVADQRVNELERKAKLYDQLLLGAELLPEGWMITVEVERDGGGVTLIDPQGNDLDYPSNRESMGDEVEDAIEEALAQQVES